MRRTAIIAAVAALLAGGTAVGGVIELTDRPEWESLTGAYITVDFTGFAPFTPITEQYADLGIHFVEGFYTVFPARSAFPNDGFGLDGNGDVTVVFDEPITSIAVEYPGIIQFELYRDGALVAVSSPFFGDAPVDNFAGVISTVAFDRAVIKDPAGEAAFDDLLFGPPIPGPGAGALLVPGLVPGRRRRRPSR